MPGRIRNKLESDKFVLARLETPEEFCCTEFFECGKSDLNEFFKEDAINYKKQLLAETYYFQLKEAMEEGITIPVAFISFLNDSITLTKEERKGSKIFLWRHIKKNIHFEMRNYESFPAVKIGRLGVHVKYQRQHIGSHLMNMVKEFFLTHNRTGCRFITVDADQDTASLGYYEKNGFSFLCSEDEGEETRIMYFDLISYRSSDILLEN